MSCPAASSRLFLHLSIVHKVQLSSPRQAEHEHLQQRAVCPHGTAVLQLCSKQLRDLCGGTLRARWPQRQRARGCSSGDPPWHARSSSSDLERLKQCLHWGNGLVETSAPCIIEHACEAKAHLQVWLPMGQATCISALGFFLKRQKPSVPKHP